MKVMTAYERRGLALADGDKMRFSDLVERLDRARRCLAGDGTGRADPVAAAELRSLRKALAEHVPVSVDEAAVLASELCLELEAGGPGRRVAQDLARSLELGLVRLAHRTTAPDLLN